MKSALLLLHLGLVSSYCFSQQPPERSRGAEMPIDIDSIVVAQNFMVGTGAAILNISPTQSAADMNSCPSAKSFNWADQGKVTPVRDQKECGACWAFAAVAAVESSYLIQTQQLATSGPDASEQQALDCSWPAYSCKGGWHNRVFDYYMQNRGSPENGYPAYKMDKNPTCSPSQSRPYSVSLWGFVEGANIPSDASLKAALCKYGPLVAAVNSKGWTTYGKTYPLWSSFANGVFVGEPNKVGLSASTVAAGDIDHDVLIVGWDDSLSSWIVKNSWGADWGDNGFIKVAYGTSNLGFNAAWVQAGPTSMPDLGAGDITSIRKQTAVNALSKGLNEQRKLNLLPF